jgi:GH35 family endo-1,4-beta-xylanase
MSIHGRFAELARASFLAALLGSTASCIAERPSAPTTPSTAMPTVTAPSEKPPAAAPTGKYGEVSGESIVPEGGLRAFQVNGKSERVKVSFVKVEGQPFAEALRAEITTRSDNSWDVQVQARVPKVVNAGDVMLATFYFRTEASRQESAEGKTEFVMELARDPWTKSVSHPILAGREWKKVHVPFVAAQSFAPNEAQLIFRLGYEPQVIELGGVTIENFGKKLALSDLPTTKITYRGMEADAPWRKAAAERIDAVRKADFRVSVKDRSGKPIPGATVTLAQTRQAFGFGSAVVAQRLTSPGNEQYQALTKELFNMAVLENNLKWQPLAGDWGPGWTLEGAQKGVAWLSQNGIPTRGHVLVWPSFKNLPRSLKALEKDPVKLRKAVRDHVRELATAMKGRLAHWDVMNEPFDNHDLMDILGEEVMVEWFKEARAADPKVKLFINDYAILSGGGGDTPHRSHYEKTIAYLIKKGAPLDGIGMQGHFGSSLTSPDDMLKILDRFAKFGKPIWITEYDVDIKDEALAAQFTRDFYTALFSHPSVAGIMMWGFWDGAHWHQNAPLYRGDFSLKPAGKAYRELVLGDFRTRASGVTDASGGYTTRAFLGSYDVTVTAAGKSQKIRAELEKNAAPLVVTVD